MFVSALGTAPGLRLGTSGTKSTATLFGKRGSQIALRGDVEPLLGSRKGNSSSRRRQRGTLGPLGAPSRTKPTNYGLLQAAKGETDDEIGVDDELTQEGVASMV